ncbi:MAG TPA: hypothetical protein VIK34_02985 [Clostridiaceae bacterium]
MKNFFVDYRISEEELFNLRKLDCNIIKCPKCELLYNAVNGHPDMLLNITGEKSLVVHRNMDQDFLDYLGLLGFNVALSKESIRDSYPDDVILNAVNLKDMFIHKLGYTDGNLMAAAEGKLLINVNQGYTKCSCAVVSDHALITSDISIQTALTDTDIDVLLLPPGDILLPGLDYGFIGGTCGLIDENHMAFYGDLAFYSYGKEVLDFLKNQDVEPIFLRRGKLADRGSILGFTI